VESITSSKRFTTRQGTILLGVIAAAIAAVALIVYLHQYRNSVNAKNAPLSVLVAKSLIQQGTSGDIVGSSNLYQVTSIPKDQVKTGAFVDAGSLTGKVALTDIYPGQQITAADFGVGPSSVTQQLDRNQRAVVISLGVPQEVGGQIGAGSHVDVWVSANGTVRELYQDMYVLGLSGGNVTLRANPKQAGTLIYAAQNASIWLVLRPTIGSTQGKPPVISSNALTGR
jgi:pilus assembly protein CpaB